MKRKLGDALELDDKPKLLSDGSSDDEFDGNNDNDDEFDLFSSETKQDWSEHPRFQQLMTTGMAMIKTIGFMSPKAGQKTKQTMKSLATTVGIKNLSSRSTSEPIIVRAMAIKRLQVLDPDSVNTYSDIKSTTTT